MSSKFLLAWIIAAIVCIFVGMFACSVTVISCGFIGVFCALPISEFVKD